MKTKRNKKDLGKVEITLDIVHGDKMLNKLMRCGDVFEDSKFLGEYESLSVVITGVVNSYTIAKQFADALEAMGRIVSFVGVWEVGGKPITNGVHYFAPKLKTISNGKEWGVAAEMIRKLGYEVETDQHMTITQITSKNG